MKEISQIQAALRLHTGRDTISLCQSFAPTGKLAAKEFNCRSSGAEPGSSPWWVRGAAALPCNISLPPSLCKWLQKLPIRIQKLVLMVFVLMDISEGISKEGAEGGNTMRRNIKLGRAVKYLLQCENGLFSAFPLRREIPSVHATLNGPSIGCGAPGRNSELFTKHWIISLRAL